MLITLAGAHLMAAFHSSEDLASDPDFMRKLWCMVLLMAIRDHASSVHFHSWRGNAALTYIISNTRFQLLSPPSDQAEWCVSAARSLLQRPGFLRWFLGGQQTPTCGTLVLRVSEHEIKWQVVTWSSGGRCGVEFFRLTPSVDAAEAARIVWDATNEADAWGLHDRLERDE